MPSCDNLDSVDESEKCTKEITGTGLCSDSEADFDVLTDAAFTDRGD